MVGILAPPARAQVEGKILRVGLFAGAPQMVRDGTWSFVEVGLRWRGDKPFAGELHVDQFDQDGDVVTSVMEVALTPDGEWHTRQVYFVPHDIARNSAVHVKLFDDRGRLTKMLDERGTEVSDLASLPITELPPETCLIIDLSSDNLTLQHTFWLDSERAGKSDPQNARKVRRLSAEELPQRAQGLEAADAIIWDNADPRKLSEQQINALVGWVQSGGRLVITAGTRWQALAESRLADALPVTITGVSEVREAQEFTDLVQSDDFSVELDKFYNKNGIARCQMTPRATGLPMPASCANEQIAYRRFIGRGEIVFVGASLRELLPVPARLARVDDEGGIGVSLGPIEGDPFLRACEVVIAKTFLSLASDVPQNPNAYGRLGHDLFQGVRRSVAYESLSGAFLVFAILFAMAYTIAAAGGTYWYLNRRSKKHLCWVAFAVVGIVGSGIGTAMVWALRGVTTQLWQTTVVDAHAGVAAAEATSLFGVKTPDHTRLSLRLPQGAGDNPLEERFGSLQPMPTVPSQESFDSRFVASENYRSMLAGVQLTEVPVRATLKEFAGTWEGPLGGALEAKLVARLGPKYQEFDEPSFIRNNLGVDLHYCYLLETWATKPESGMAAHLIGCFFLGDLPKTGPASSLNAEALRQRLYFTSKSGAAEGDSATRIDKYPLLRDKAKNWWDQVAPSLIGTGENQLRGGELGADDEYYSLLLLSVFNALEPDNQDSVRRRSHGRSLDCTSWLTNRTAVLVGWSEDAPPAKLEINGRIQRPNRTRTMYRFLIPVDRPKQPAPARTEAAQDGHADP